MIDPFNILRAEKQYPLPEFVKWWYNRFGATAVYPKHKGALLSCFIGFNILAIAFDVYENIIIKNILLVIANLPVLIVVISGFICVRIKNRIIKKRIDYLETTTEEYNETIEKLRD